MKLDRDRGIKKNLCENVHDDFVVNIEYTYPVFLISPEQCFLYVMTHKST